MQYCLARFKRYMAEKAYRVYTSDLLKAVSERAAGVSVQKRYIDIISAAKQDDRTCEEITNDIVSRCGLEVKKPPHNGLVRNPVKEG